MTKVLHQESGKTHSDAHGRTGKKKKHWDVCIETSQCLNANIEMFSANIPMFFKTLQKDKKTKRTDMTIQFSSWRKHHEISY